MTHDSENKIHLGQKEVYLHRYLSVESCKYLSKMNNGFKNEPCDIRFCEKAIDDESRTMFHQKETSCTFCFLPSASKRARFATSSRSSFQPFTAPRTEEKGHSFRNSLPDPILCNFERLECPKSDISRHDEEIGG
jgi:hypothetical protein